jgi:trimeric autotransporter adhesin
MADAVMYDSSSHNSVTLGGVGDKAPVALHNVADGVVNASSTDAVNGSQLYALGSSTADALGGGSTVNPNGSITNPTYVMNGGDTYTNVAGALTNLDGRVTQNTTDIANGTDAVNVDQLNQSINTATGNAVQQATGQANAYTNQQIGMVRKQVNTLGAAAMAASSLVPNARAEGNFQMSAAVGTYGGESALAVGANWYASDRLLINAHVSKSTGGGGTGASVGATFGF